MLAFVNVHEVHTYYLIYHFIEKLFSFHMKQKGILYLFGSEMNYCNMEVKILRRSTAISFYFEPFINIPYHEKVHLFLFKMSPTVIA